jgi:(1->4)-alpha-D-glucan 1-alpha-D-glucosylmutase
MTTPRATYRLQFREGMTFERAAELVPYLADLGISHLYASPIFTAAPDSSHGYDVADHQELDPVLGGVGGFARLAKALKKHELGLLLDIVPNHMAVSTQNPWWRDVLKWGRASRYARHFDIDWSAPRLLLPVLGEPYGEALVEGKFELRLDAERGELAFGYHDLALPLSPETYPVLLGTSGVAEPDLAGALRDSTRRRQIDDAVRRANRNLEFLHRMHEAQIWRLAYWRLAREALTHRRFFEIADLIGVRVEDEAVFADVHKLPIQLGRDGIVDGLRVDHVDGLADPKAYLARLRKASGIDYVVVEKILGSGEALRADWECAGTTGYEVGQLITAVQVDSAGRDIMTQGWTGFSGDGPDYARQVLNAKRRIFTVNLAGELRALVWLAHRIALGDRATRDYGEDDLRLALVELAAVLPVYRTYVEEDEASAEDRAVILQAAERVIGGREVEDERVIRFVASLLVEPANGSPERADFVRRFQQTTGALTAKAVEDTVFYRYNRLVALNEVGAEPEKFGVDGDTFHEVMRRRAEAWPRAMSATSTHDTKRGEDARARLAVLSEMPREWLAAVSHWHEASESLREELPRGPAPGLRGEWLFYQALAGAWPPELSLDDEEGLAELCERLVGFMTKALREAKRRTSWTDQNEPFEAAVENYIRELFSPTRRHLLHGIHSVVTGIEPAGLLNSLSQLALKLTLPGVPDIYQGCELLDYSMVDPDNRRPVDFALRQRLMRELPALSPEQAMRRWREGAAKFWLLHRLLQMRKSQSELFERGAYQPVEIEGEGAAHVIAFARILATRCVVVAVPRLMLRHIDVEQPSWISGSSFVHTRLRLPFEAARCTTLTGALPASEGTSPAVSVLWRDFPVAVLQSV